MKFRKDDLLVVLLRVIATFHIQLQEAVEQYLACLDIELFGRVAACDLDICLEHLGVSHL